MQIMPPTGRDIVNYLADDGYMTTLKKIQTLPEENIRAGCRYIYWIKEVIDLADEGRKVFISYNGGLKRADLPDDKLPRETKEYVKQVIAYRAIIKLWEKIGIPLSAGNLAQK
jgi:soluble lytic murein transglycosylase-like protein